MPSAKLLLGTVRRLIDRRPLAAHLYVTEQCNLDCHYCNEYDNSIPHPRLDDVRRWLDKIRSLGVLRLGIQGGEPLMHPDLVEIIRYAKEDAGFLHLSMATNGFLLTRETVRALDVAGLDKLQFSVDRMTPIESTRKSLKSVADKLEWFNGTRIRLQVAGVLFEDTVGEMEEVLDYALERGIPAHARVAHRDEVKGGGVVVHDRSALLRFLDLETRRKAAGEKVHSSWNTLDYQRRLLLDDPVEWSCTAGYKYFFVSARGHFWPCSQVRTERNILDITLKDLEAYDHPKPCQTGCGVYCMIDTSRFLNNPVTFGAREFGLGVAAKLQYFRSRESATPTSREAVKP